MDTRRIGSLEFSVVGLGCNNFGWRVDEAGRNGFWTTGALILCGWAPEKLIFSAS